MGNRLQELAGITKKDLLKEEVVRTTKSGDVIVNYKGKEYIVAYSADGFGSPYGIAFPGEDVYRSPFKDRKAKAMLKKLQPILDDHFKSKK